MVLPSPEAIERSGGHYRPLAIEWLTKQVALLIEQNASVSDDGQFAVWPVSRFDGEVGATFDGIDIFALQGMVNLADQWEDLVDQSHDGYGLSDLQLTMLDHIRRIQAEVHWLCDVPVEDDLPSVLGLYSETERDALEDILLYGVADSKGDSGTGLREPFRLLGIALHDQCSQGNQKGLLPLCLNERPNSLPALSVACPVEGAPSDADLRRPVYSDALNGMRRLADTDSPAPCVTATAPSFQ